MTRISYQEAVSGPTGYDTAHLIGILASATNPDGTPYSLPVAPVSPAAADVKTGHQTLTATTAATTLVTVPAGRTWSGTIGASVSVGVAAAAATVGQATATFATAGTNVTPAAGTVFAVDAITGANAATGTVGSQASNYGSTPLVVIAPAGNAVTITVASTNTGTNSRVDAFAIGALL